MFEVKTSFPHTGKSQSQRWFPGPKAADRFGADLTANTQRSSINCWGFGREISGGSLQPKFHNEIPELVHRTWQPVSVLLYWSLLRWFHNYPWDLASVSTICPNSYKVTFIVHPSLAQTCCQIELLPLADRLVAAKKVKVRPLWLDDRVMISLSRVFPGTT